MLGILIFTSYNCIAYFVTVSFVLFVTPCRVLTIILLPIPKFKKGLGPSLPIVQIASSHHQKDHMKMSKFTKFGYVTLHYLPRPQVLLLSRALCVWSCVTDAGKKSPPNQQAARSFFPALYRQNAMVPGDKAVALQ